LADVSLAIAVRFAFSVIIVASTQDHNARSGPVTPGFRITIVLQLFNVLTQSHTRIGKLLPGRRKPSGSTGLAADQQRPRDRDRMAFINRVPMT
jgi:hypothetical protein